MEEDYKAEHSGASNIIFVITCRTLGGRASVKEIIVIPRQKLAELRIIPPVSSPVATITAVLHKQYTVI